MKHIKRIITLVILSSFSLTAQAQSTKKADKHFAKYEFVEAIEDYNKLIEDTQFHQEMFKYWQIKNRLRLRNYLPVRIKVIKLIEALDTEINTLKEISKVK